MRKWLCWLLACLLPFSASAEGVLVAIGLSEWQVKVSGRTVQAAGVGKRAPWGIHEADLIYENLLFQYGQTRLSCWFGRTFPQAVGPVRSARLSHYQQRAEHDAMLVISGHAGYLINELPQADALTGGEKILDAKAHPRARDCTERAAGVKAPDNLSVNLQLLSPSPDTDAVADTPTVLTGKTSVLTLDWGHPCYESRFVYDAVSGLYFRFQGDAPLLSFSDGTRKDGDGVQLSFANVIIQHVSYTWLSAYTPVVACVGSGAAEFFMDGRHETGTWIRDNLNAPTRYLDADGNELHLKAGKTYIAQFPQEGHLRLEP